MRKTNRIGEQKINKWGSLMTIIEYKNANDIIVEFENGYRAKVQYIQFVKGNIVNPYDKTVNGVGYIGYGKYNTQKEGVCSPSYIKWKLMMDRCYNKEKHKESKNVTYKDCSVCEEWHNFQNFAKWFDENYYEIDGEIMCLDKDILKKGNKIYSPENCIFVPNRINVLFVKCDKLRGGYPIGVGFHKRNNVFRAYCSIFDKETKHHKQKHLGHYNTPEEAFLVYKEFKENYIKQVAEEYKDKIPQKLYEAMYEYEVEIND